jgi:hypothetical protein
VATMTYGRIHAAPTFKRGRPRPRPWPYHATLNKVGLVLGSESRKGAPGITTKKPEDQGNVAPTDYGENAQNPVFGRTHTWRTFHLGMGLAVEDEDPSRAEGRYRWAINADCSVANRLAMKGPAITTVTPATRDSVNGVAKFFDLKGQLYWLNGRYLTRLDSDSAASMVQDFGVGSRAVDVSVFASNGLGGAVFAYIAVLEADGDDALLWRFDGTACVQHTDANMLARNVVAIGRNLYRANRVNQISVVDVDTDPWVWDNWNAENQFIIGDKSAPIVGLVENAAGVLVVLKTDGIYSVPPDPTQQESIRYFPFLRFGQAADNGQNWGVYLNDLYVRYGESLWRLDTDFQIEAVGFNRVGTVDGPVKGRTTAFAGHANLHAYCAVWDADTDAAFLLKYGSHQPNERGEPERIEAWHGSICPPILNNRITALYVTPFRAPAAHNRMYLGLRDGSVGFFTLPCVPDAAACDEYRFSLDASWVVLPNWHGGFQNSVKPLRYAAVSGDNLSADRYATVQYRLNPIAADAVPGTPPWVDLGGNFDTLPSERVEFPEGSRANVVALRLSLHNTATTGSPLITSLSLRWRLTTDFQQVFDLIILAEDGLVTRDGTPLRRGAKRIREHVRGIAESGAIVELVLPDEEIKLVSIYDYGETLGWYERFEKWVSALRVSVAEDATGATYGTYGRLRALKYGDLRGMKYGDLRSL